MSHANTYDEGGCATETEMGKERARDKPYSVNLWGSKPGTDDDCHTGDDFETLEDAMKVYRHPFTHFKGPGNQGGESYYSGELWVELDGPDVHEERQERRGRGKRDNGDEEWRREIANEAGMLHGVQAYNEVMGYDNEEPWGESGSAF